MKTAPSKYLGIDPASDGAAILLDSSGAVSFSIVWKKVRRKKGSYFSLRMHRDGKIILYNAKRFSDIGQYISSLPEIDDTVLLACEDAYYRPNPKTTIIIARLSGLIISPIEIKIDGDCRWVKAAEWRHKVLRLSPFTRRDQAKSASLKLVPSLVKGLSNTLHALGRLDHLTDAAGVAYWAYQSQDK